MNKADIRFEKVKELVMQGLTIYNACKQLKISTNTLYNSLGELQKRELKSIRMANSDYGKMVGMGNYLHLSNVLIIEE